MTHNSMENMTLAQVFESADRLYPEKTSIEDGPVKLSYRQLNEGRIAVAKACLAAGIRKGDRFAIWAPNIHEWILAASGAQTIGAILIPLNTRYKATEAAFSLRHGSAKVLFTVSGFLGVDYAAMLVNEDLPELEKIISLRGNSAAAQNWDDFLSSGALVDDETLKLRSAEVSPADTLDILYTSGTTGEPKGVVTCHGQNIRVFSEWSKTVGLEPEDNFIIIPPFFHSFGYKAGWLSSVISCTKMLLATSFDAEEILQRIDKERISVLTGPPTIFQSLLHHPNRQEYDLGSLRLAVTGAASVSVSLVERMKSDLGFETVITAYGLTEACGLLTMCCAEDDPATVAMTSGTALEGVKVRCVDLKGEDVDPGHPGEIWARGYNVMQGYFRDPDRTREAITEKGWLRTGDVGVIDEKGYVRITGRIKEMFIVGGFNCYPAEIENQLLDIEGIDHAAVIGVSDERMGEVAKAFVVRSAGSSIIEAEIVTQCRELMANFKVPRSVEFLDSLPMNAAGKICKQTLRKNLVDNLY